MNFTVINYFHSDQRGHHCFNCEQWVHHLPNNHATLSRQRQVQRVFQALNQTGTRADATMAKALHQCFRHSFPTSWHYDRHICWTWYCLDRFRMERWREVVGGGPGWQDTTITLWEACRGPVRKKEPSRFSTSTENQCLNLQRLKTCRYTISKIQVYSWTATTYVSSPRAPATNTRGINKMNR